MLKQSGESQGRAARLAPLGRATLRLNLMRLRNALIKVVVASSILLSPSMASAQSDEQLRNMLVGTWAETRQVECEQHRQRMQLREDGTFEVAGFIGGCNALSSFTWRGTWKVVGRQFVYTTTFSLPADLYRTGGTFSDKIVTVTSRSWEMIEQSTGSRSIAERVE